MSSTKPAKKFESFRRFYPFYLSEHKNGLNRLLHVVGTSLVILFALYIIFTLQFHRIYVLPLLGYSFAWVGHFFVEKNRPATFTYPLYSLAGDFVMWYDVLTGRLPCFPKKRRKKLS
mmetsp:Transcript_11079/g.12186  ORF Transcript_11079/g.12186 Transcript_11079/m.12186 type:complete len:117 (+) Transcript_11079:96-446(+)